MTTGRLTHFQLFTLALAESRGAWRRFIFFIICIAVGVGAVMTIKSFSTLLNDAIQGESKGLLAADIEVRGSWEQTPADIAFQQEVLPQGTEFQSVKELHVMTQHQTGSGKASLLVELKAVPAQAPFYPMYGTIELNPPHPLNELLSRNGAVVDPAFLLRTHLKIGDSFQLGKTQVRINGTVGKEPDRISRAFSIGPRVFVTHTTLQEAALIRTGSRVRHRTLIRLPNTIELEQALAILEQGLSDKATSLRTYKDMESSLNKSIERMGQYLSAVGVIALLLGGIGVAMIVRTFMAQKLDTIAILTCLGASSHIIFKIYLLQSLLLGLSGSVLGVIAGYGLQFSLPPKLSGLLNLNLEPVFYWVPAVHSLALGMITTLLFCLWPLFCAAKTKPLCLFRRNFEEEVLSPGTQWERWMAGLLFAAIMAGIVIWEAGSIKRGAVFLLALGVSTLLLSGIAALVLKGLKNLPPPDKMTGRYGFANLYRPNSQARSIVTCLGMGIMLVLTVRLVQMDMITMLKENTETRPPNYFFIDIQSDQTETFIRTLDRIAPEAERTLTPLIRSRFHGIDGRLAENWKYQNKPKEEWFVTREFVTTHSDGGDLPKDNEIVQGTWWDVESSSVAQVSLEEDAARRLGAKIGSQLTMDIQGIKVTAPVTSIRKVNWRNMRTNFYMIFSPGALKGAPVTHVSTVHVPESKELLLQHAMVEALPNITALSTRDIVTTIENVVEKLKTLVDFMSVFTIAAGLVILAGSIVSTKYRRLKESAVLKILGAKRNKVASILGVEYATIGIIAGVVGVGLSSVLSWAVMKYLVKAPWNAQPGVMVWALGVAVLITTLTGIFASLDVLKNKPLKTLRQVDG